MWVLGVATAWTAVALVVCLGVARTIRLAGRPAARRGIRPNFTIDPPTPRVAEPPAAPAYARSPEIPVARSSEPTAVAQPGVSRSPV